jgi:hypothetical protein
MGIDLHLNTCVDTQSPKYLEMAQGHISLSLLDLVIWNGVWPVLMHGSKNPRLFVGLPVSKTC